MAELLSNMCDNFVVVWDLETAPDLAAAGRVLGLTEKSDDDIRAEMGGGFPRPPLHSIVCIGALIAQRCDGA